MSAYRENAREERDEPVVKTWRVEPFTTISTTSLGDPACPKCGAQRVYAGKVCYGEKSFFGRRKCPKRPHFHPRCGQCGANWLAAPRDDKEGGEWA